MFLVSSCLLVTNKQTFLLNRSADTIFFGTRLPPCHTHSTVTHPITALSQNGAPTRSLRYRCTRHERGTRDRSFQRCLHLGSRVFLFWDRLLITLSVFTKVKASWLSCSSLFMSALLLFVLGLGVGHGPAGSGILVSGRWWVSFSGSHPAGRFTHAGFWMGVQRWLMRLAQPRSFWDGLGNHVPSGKRDISFPRKKTEPGIQCTLLESFGVTGLWKISRFLILLLGSTVS